MSEMTVGRITFTPGPWIVSPPTRENPSQAMVTACSGFVGIYSAPLTNETIANARLIAAAPDLLAACQTFLKYCKRRDGSLADFEHAMMAFVEDGSALQECIHVIAAAIAKAEGAVIVQGTRR